VGECIRALYPQGSAARYCSKVVQQGSAAICDDLRPTILASADAADSPPVALLRRLVLRAHLLVQSLRRKLELRLIRSIECGELHLPVVRSTEDQLDGVASVELAVYWQFIGSLLAGVYW
jgi:hypothetical protein